MVEKDLQVEQLSNEIQELEELVGTRENTIEVLEDQLINTQQQLAEANQHLDMHHQENPGHGGQRGCRHRGRRGACLRLGHYWLRETTFPRVERCLVCSLGRRDRVRSLWR
jgi:ribosomal protein L19E